MSVSLLVQIDWDNNGNFTTVGDDITEHVIDVSCSGGIDDPMARVANVGQLTVTLDNQTRAFSPLYASSPFYGKLLPNLPIRVQVTDGVTTWTIFTGKTRKFVPEPGQYSTRRATLEAVDLLGFLQDYEINLPLQENQTTDTLLKKITANTFRTGLASGSFTFSALPANNDTVTVNGTLYTFKSALSSPVVANEVLIAATITATIDNLVAAINGELGAGITYSTGTTRPTDCTAKPNATYYRAVNSDRPVRYYRLGEPSGTTAVDSGTNGTAGNGTYVDTPTLGAAGALTNDPNTAVTFNGSSEYVSLPTLDMSGRSFTIEAWINPVDNNVDYQAVLSVFDGTKDGTLFYRGNIDGSAYYKINFYFDALSQLQSANGSITAGTWNHVAVTYNLATDTATLYINGTARDTSNIGPYAGNTTPVIQIAMRDSIYNPYTGSIDEVALYLDALTAIQIAAHYAARAVSTGLTIEANARGAWGNAITLAESSTAITVSAATLTGGTDYSAIVFDTGVATIAVAGDKWSNVSALSAISSVINSEQGLYWSTRAGVLTFKKRNWELIQNAAVVDLTLSSEHNGLDMALDMAHIFNYVSVSFTPTAELSVGVVASAKSPVTVPGLSGTVKRSITADFGDGRMTTVTSKDPYVVTLDYIDPGTGKFSGAKDLVLPLAATTDFTATDGNGTDYTNGDPATGIQCLNFMAGAKSGGVEVSVSNTALGSLTLSKLQVRGVAIVSYDPQKATVDDAVSIAAYGRRTYTVDIPMGGTQDFAQVLAGYLLNRYSAPTFRAYSLTFYGETAIGAVNLFSLEIGDTITLTDYQGAITAQKYMITGYSYSLRGGSPSVTSITFNIRRLDDVNYFILDDAVFGVLDGSNYLTL
jgi:hypothetical protein